MDNNIIKIESYKIINNVPVHVININGLLWVKTSDICNAIGYKNHNEVTNLNISKINVKQFSDFVFRSKYKIQQHTKYTNKEGIEELIRKSRKLSSYLNEILAIFNIKINTLNPFLPTKILSKEQYTLDKIIKVFKNKKYISQYTIKPYRTDLYFTDYKLIVECDEFNHSDRNPKKEKAREIYIKQKLKCSFIRFDPDDPLFDIFEVINKIYEHIKKHKSQSTYTQNEKWSIGLQICK